MYPPFHPSVLRHFEIAGPNKPPKYRGKRPRPWSQLLALVVVLSAVVAGFIGLYQALSGMAVTAEAEASATVVAPCRAECLAIMDSYGRWVDADTPVTLDEFAAMNEKAADAAVRAGADLVADLRTYPPGAVTDLRVTAEVYVREMRALKLALSSGTAAHEQSVAAHDAASAVHQSYSALQDEYCW